MDLTEGDRARITRSRPHPAGQPGRCQKTTRTLRAMLHTRRPVVVTAETDEGFRCYMASGHPGPCAAWGPDGLPWIFTHLRDEE